MTFNKINEPLRTNAALREGVYNGHIKYDTPITKLKSVDMIKDFVVADSLHLLELGVMKRLLTGWRTGNLSKWTKWSIGQQDVISELIKHFKMPTEIHRDIRTLKLFAHWKGLEFLKYYDKI